METFREFLAEAGGGAEAGKFEIVKTPLPKARELMEAVCSEYKMKPEHILPDFDKNYLFAQDLCKYGKTKRKDMPVIRRSDVSLLLGRLADGTIDINKPYAPDTNPRRLFPTHLDGEDATSFLHRGLQDGNKKDDRVNSRHIFKNCGDLKPIQKQIYLDKALTFMNMGSFKFIEMIQSTATIVSSDNRIIDGHHRWLFAVLLNPKIRMNTVEIDLPLNTLLPLLISYGDSIGNKRNL